jgi:DNA-binding SARP family transcriptional activator
VRAVRPREDPDFAEGGGAVRFAILGPLEVCDPEGRTVDVPAGRPARLLVGLLLRADRHVPVDWLVELLWNDRPPRSYLANLHTHVSRLRRALPGVPIDRQHDSYRITVDPGQVDLHQFIQHTAAGTAAVAPDQAATHFRHALALYRGAPGVGTPAGPFEPDVTRLTELWLTTVEGLTEADLAAGRFTEAIMRLGPLVRQHPLRESLWAQLMLALAGAGRVAEALEVFHEVRMLLRDQLGADPGCRLRGLHTSILRGRL